MSDEIDELVDWQLSQRNAVDAAAHMCQGCRSRWTGYARTCPECGRSQ